MPQTPQHPAGSALTRREWWAAAGVVAVLALGGWGVWAWSTRSTSPALVPSPSPPVRRDTPTPTALPASLFEMRAMWVATVDNIDWPSSRTLSSEQQQRELHELVALAQRLHLNAIILQVRPSCDAIYPSTLEPWSEFLTGAQGVAPDPPYDPLQTWVDACHAAGIELHAWFNPFRARHFKAQGPDDPSHVNRARPEIVRRYGRPKGEYRWMDPGERESHDRALAAILDVLRRYDIDGVHLDDYFYPYPVDALPFPDDRPYARFKAAGGTLSKPDWRRATIDAFVERLSREVHALKPWVKLGISPFGIWRPGNPEGVEGMDSVEKLHADSRRWLREGWLDYLTPQLYWAVDAPAQPYAPLLEWWVDQNRLGRLIVPGNFTSRIPSPSPREPEDPKATWPPDEILRQVAVTRATPGASGNVHFSAVALLENRFGIADSLAQGPYASPALIPPMPWLATGTPVPPRVRHRRTDEKSILEWDPAPGASNARWIVASLVEGSWRYQLRRRDETLAELDARATTAAVYAVDRVGQVAPPVVLDVRQ